MKKKYQVTALCFALVFTAACASRGPVVPKPPAVRVSQFDSLLFTPDVIKFRAKVRINNRTRSRLKIDKVDYAVNVQDKEIFTDSFDRLKPMKARGNQTVTFPFQIALSDIKDQAVNILAEEALRVTFKGQVWPAGDSGFGPIPFQAIKTITMPKAPSVSIERTEGSPLRVFTVFLKIKNPNAFPLNFKSVSSFIEIDGAKYSLLRTDGTTDIMPGSSGTIALKMEQTTGKTLSMALNIAQSATPNFSIGGEISCGTPDGTFYLPLKLSSN